RQSRYRSISTFEEGEQTVAKRALLIWWIVALGSILGYVLILTPLVFIPVWDPCPQGQAGWACEAISAGLLILVGGILALLVSVLAVITTMFGATLVLTRIAHHQQARLPQSTDAS